MLKVSRMIKVSVLCIVTLLGWVQANTTADLSDFENGTIEVLTDKPEKERKPQQDTVTISAYRPYRRSRTYSDNEPRPTASAKDYPKGSGVGFYQEVGVGSPNDKDSRNGRSYVGSTEASVSSATNWKTSQSLFILGSYLISALRIGHF